LKCGLMITCNALKETNYMEEEVRTGQQVHLRFVLGFTSRGITPCLCMLFYGTWCHVAGGSLLTRIYTHGTWHCMLACVWAQAWCRL
jgi:hypothetical protein